MIQRCYFFQCLTLHSAIKIWFYILHVTIKDIQTFCNDNFPNVLVKNIIPYILLC